MCVCATCMRVLLRSCTRAAHQNAHFKGKTAPGLAELLLVIRSWEWKGENWSFVYWRCTPLGWAARLLTRLAAMQWALFLTPTPPHPSPTTATLHIPPEPPPQPPLIHSLSLSFSVSAWRLPLLQLTLVLPLLGEMCAELLTPGLIFLLFPISSISSSWRLWRRQRMGGRVGIRG